MRKDTNVRSGSLKFSDDVSGVLKIGMTDKDIRIPPFVYRKYPKMREALSRRCAAYNEQLEMVERMEEEGDILVIRPQKPVVVDRIERDIQKLTDLYEEGYECAKRQLEVL